MTTKETMGRVRPAKHSTAKNVGGTYAAHYRDGVRTKALPTMPRSVYASDASRRNRSIFTLVQKHIKKHNWLFRWTFASERPGNPSTRYYSANKEALRAIIGAYLDGLSASDPVEMDRIEAAVLAYSASHPDTIIIGQRDGYNSVYLNGAWPRQVVMRSTCGNPPIVVQGRD